ncbi:MAG: helix-turn-helix transcriptional regulator [Chloroflexota bacterium]
MLSLASGVKHGHAMMLDIEAFSGIRIGPGSLYGAIERLERGGLIAPVPSDDRRQPYELTGLGRASLNAQVSALDRLATLGRERLSEA